MERDVALPRLNGELVFSAPWEGRALGMAIALKDGEEFRDRLIIEVALTVNQAEPAIARS